MAPDDESSLGILTFRMAATEAAIKDVKGDVQALRSEVLSGLASLAYVNREVYVSERDAARSFAEETRKIAENARTVAWGVATLLIAAVGMLLAVIKAVAG